MSAQDIILNQHLDALDQLGFLEMNAKPEYAREAFRVVLLARPSARMVSQVGPHCITQIIFLPHKRQELRQRFTEERQQFERAAAAAARALVEL